MKYIVFFLFCLFFPNLGQTQNQNCACCTEKHKEFAFWQGEWNVTNANETQVGTNSIKLIQNKCVLQENWVSATKGYTGTSQSFYNLQSKQWEQLWIDNQGISLHLKGNKIGNQMILRTDAAKNSNGQDFVNRVTWTDNGDGSVRQLWEVVTQTEKGEIVSVAFDGLYSRRAR